MSKNVKDIKLSRIELSLEMVSILMEKFDVHKFYVQSALSMTIIPSCGFESEAENVREARTDYYRSDTNPEKQRASVRKFIELAISEEDVMEAFYLSNNILEGKFAVRKMAEIIFAKELALVY